MRYKVYSIDNRDNTLRTLGGMATIYTHTDVQRMKGVIDIGGGILQREGFGLYLIPETHLYFNFDILRSSIHTIPGTAARLRLLRPINQAGTLFYKYIKSITRNKNEI